MSYQLGIDLGTTYTAAAISRATERSPGGVDVVTLGARSATVASVMYLADDGSVLVGEAAERRALTDPDRVVREFKRRVGDEIPLMIAGRPHQAHELSARMVRWVVDLVSEREGGPPRRIAVTHPASWGAHKKDLFSGALRTVGLAVTFLAEPQAAAVSYASAERVDPGSTVAVYDLGGGTFDAAVVRKTGSGSFELLGQPEGIERLGGIDFDDVVFGFVREAIGDKLETLDPEDPDVLSAVARLRRECVEAKEALSSDTEATIPVLLPDLRTQSRITRGEFEAMIRPALEETIVALRRAVGSAGLTPDDLSAVLLVGGSSRIPLVSQLVSEELTRPVAVDADPKTAIAMGAALAISPQPPQQAPAPRPAGPMQTGGMPPARPVGPGAGAAAAGAAAGAAALASGPRGGGHPGPGGPGGPPPRPGMGRAEPPPRPDPRPVPMYDQGSDDYGDGYYAEPEKRKQTGLWIGVGGLVAIAVILAIVFWPSTNAGSTGTSSNSGLTPANSAPAEPTTEKKTTEPTRKSPTKATKAPPPATKTTTHPTTSPETKPSEPNPTSQDNTPPTTGNNDDGRGHTSQAPGSNGSGDRNTATNKPESTPQANSGLAPPAEQPTSDSGGWVQPGSSNAGTTGWAQPGWSHSVTQPNSDTQIDPVTSAIRTRKI